MKQVILVMNIYNVFNQSSAIEEGKHLKKTNKNEHLSAYACSARKTR